MPQGTLEVLLVSAKGLENTDFLNNMDPFVILTCRTQEQKSSVASVERIPNIDLGSFPNCTKGKGSEPEWNETFVFNLTGDVSELTLKILDSDVGSNDDFVGEATIPLDALFTEGSVPATAYNVVKNEEYRGEIRVGLTFTPEESRSEYADEESLGGWRESSYRD